MNQYKAMQARWSKAIHEYTKGRIFWAYSQEQADEGMKSINLQEGEKVVHFGGGGYGRKEDVHGLHRLTEEMQMEQDAAVEADPTGDGFVFDMFLYELENHEYSYTGDPTDALDALGYTAAQVMENPKLLHGFQTAAAQAMENAEDW